MIHAKGIVKSFGTLKVLKGVDLSVGKSEVLSIMGASGAGKSTLLQILGTLSTPDEGSLEVDGTDVLALRGDALARFRNRRVGFVFQFHHLLPIPSAAFTYVDLAELHLGGVGVVIEGLHYIVLEVNHIQLAGSPRNERTLKGNGNQNYAEDYVEQVNIQQR